MYQLYCDKAEIFKCRFGRAKIELFLCKQFLHIHDIYILYVTPVFCLIICKIVYNLGIMQLAMLAPYSNLATSVAATLVPTLLGAKIKDTEENEPANASKSMEEVPVETGNKYYYSKHYFKLSIVYN